jgi:hypothetical protein
MFVKLLVLLISNVLVSFSVLWCCRSLQSNCDLKVILAKKALGSALERSRCDRAHCAQA